MDKEKVLFKGKQYTVIYKYSSGYWEIREEGNLYNTELVHQSEVQGFEKQHGFLVNQEV